MVGRKRNKGLIDQVSDIATDVADRLAPHVDNAREQIAPYIADARDKAGPAIADARDKAGPAIADALDKARPYVEDARDRFNDDVLPAVTAAVADARDKAAPYIAEAREEASRRGKATAAALKGEVDAPKKKGGKLKKVLFAGGLIGLGAFVFNKLKGGSDDSGWQSSYVPPAPPAPVPTPTPTAPTATDVGTPTDDAAGSSPDEAVADAVEAPHAVTTPDEPVEETDVEEQPPA